MKPYEGYTIETGFLVGNLFEDFGDEFGGDIGNDTGAYDVSASAERYAEMCQEALEKEFPGAEVTIRFEYAIGATPIPLQTRVADPNGFWRQNIAVSVVWICERIWESWDWVVYEEEA